jgi:uncharacterized protein YodC (DUF2158 family)
MATENFKIGDVVSLKTGGEPLMVVKEIREVPCIGKIIICIYFNPVRGVFFTESFVPETIDIRYREKK